MIWIMIEIYIFNDKQCTKPTDLDLHCLLRQSMSCSAREGLIFFLLFYEKIFCEALLMSYFFFMEPVMRNHKICFHGEISKIFN